MWKKSRFVAAAAVLALALTACGADPEPGDSADPGEGGLSGSLDVLYSSTFKAAFEPVVAAFDEQYPNVELNVDYAGDDLLTVVATQAQAGNLPDVFPTVPGPPGSGLYAVGSLAAQNYLLDLSDTSWASEVPALWREAVGIDDKVYAYPGTLQGLGGIYNMTKMDELGLEVPHTWTDLLAFCSDARRAGVYAYAQGLNKSDGLQMVYLALSGTLIFGPNPEFAAQLADGSVTHQDSPWRDILEKYVAMNDAECFGDGALGRDRTQGGTDLAAGNALGMIEVGAGVASVQTQAPDAEFAFEPIPATDNPEDTYFPAGPGFTIAANADTDNPEAVKALFDMLAQPEVINAYSGAYASVPVIPNDEFQPPASLETFNDFVTAERITDYTNMGGGQNNAAVTDVTFTEIQRLLMGEQTVDGVLDAMQAAFEG